MANSSIFRLLISNPNKITPKFLLKPTQFLITRPFSSDAVTESTQIPTPDPITLKPITVKPTKQTYIVEELFKTRTEGLFVSASKVFDRMSKRLRPFSNNRKMTHEAMDRSRGHGKIPDVVAHIAVIEAYANAGQTNDNANKVYLKMIGAGSIPNVHTYNMLIKMLASTGTGDHMMIGQAQKYLIEMLDKGMKPDPATSVAVFKALAKEGRVREGKEFLQDVKGRGFVVDHKLYKEVVKGRGGAVKVLKGKGGNLVKGMLEIFFDKKI